MILIFNEDREERRRLVDVLQSDDLKIFDTSRALEAIRMLKSEDIDLVIASSKLDAMEVDEFKVLAHGAKPGIDILFLNPLSGDENGVSMSDSEFSRFLQGSLSSGVNLRDRISELKEFALEFTSRLIQIFGASGRHNFNRDHLVAGLSRQTALRMGLDADMADTIQMGALLKDLGMLTIHQQFLDERRRFTAQELIPIKKHPLNTIQILRDIRFPWNVEAVILQHHENYDGSGYPNGLSGRRISVGARILHIADSYVAMTTERPYRKPMKREEAFAEILRNTGTQFDPEVYEAFHSVVNEEPEKDEVFRSLLFIEKGLNIAPLVKLSSLSNNYDIAHEESMQEALQVLSRKVPDTIIMDLETIEKNSLVLLFNSFYEIPKMQECSYIFILPNIEYPRPFKGGKVHYITKPIDLNELYSAIQSASEGETASEPSIDKSGGLRGSLNDFSLTDIVQILNLGLKTAKVELNRDGASGVLYMASGNIVHASTGALKGKDAFLEFINWDTGEFHIRHGLTTKDTNIQSETMHLLLEGAKRLDEKTPPRGANLAASKR